MGMGKVFLCLVVAAVARQFKYGGPVTSLKPTSGSELTFNLASLEVNNEMDGSVSLHVPGWMKTNEPGHPELPVLRASMLLPRGVSASEVHAVVHNAKKDVFPLSTWGMRVKHSQGKECLCNHCRVNSTIAASPSAYSGVYPTTPAVIAVPTGTWRDVEGMVIEVHPVSVDHAKGHVEVLHGADIKLEMLLQTTDSNPLVVDPAFYDAYSHVFDNWEHQAHEYVAGAAGRVLVVYESQFQSQAQSYANLIKSRGFPSVLMLEGSGSSSSIKSAISGHYNEPEKLSYVTIIGRNVKSPTGSQTYTECDNCYAMMSGQNLDLFVGRISGGSSSDIEAYLTKLKNYPLQTGSWLKHMYGTAATVMGDEVAAMTAITSNFKQGGFSTDWARAESTSGDVSAQKMNSGLGVFAYIGHGSGTAWNTPRFSVDQVQSLNNADKLFFEIDVSCDNGGFQEHSPCMGEALITSRGGAIATMMSSPEMKGTMCKKYQEQAALAIVNGAASRVGPVYVTGLTKGNQLDPDMYTVEAYNVFGDPTQWLNFAKGPSPTPVPPSPTPPTPSPTPSPVPTPVPTPSPSPGSCHAISPLATDDWCKTNCAAGFCPADLCKCDTSVMV